MSSLMELVRQKKDIEQKIIDESGEFTEEIEIMLSDTSIALRDKVDAYGYVLDKMANNIAFLKERKARVNEVQKHVEKDMDKIKGRLNYLSETEGELIGNEYKFKPYISKTSDGIDKDKVEPKYLSYSLTLNDDEYNRLKNLLIKVRTQNSLLPPEIQILTIGLMQIVDNAETSCKVSDLPKDHPAIRYKITPTVRSVK